MRRDRRVSTYYLYSPDEPELRGWWVQVHDVVGLSWEDGPREDRADAVRLADRISRDLLVNDAKVVVWRVVGPAVELLAKWLYKTDSRKRGRGRE